MLKGQPVTIVGAGIAGLSCAIAMAQRGAVVRVLEQAAEISEIGAGLQITPNGVAVLDALSLGGQVRQVGMVSQAVVLRDYRLGTQVVRLDMAKSGGGRPYLLLHRSDLIALLADAAHRAGVEILLNRAVVGVADTASGVNVKFANGDCETAEILVGADGLHSQLRPVLNRQGAPFFTGQVAWRAIVAGADISGVELYMGPGRHVVTYPLRGGALTNIVAVEERATWADEGWHHTCDPSELRRAFSSFCPAVRDLLDRVEQPHLWGLFRHKVAENWCGHRAALIGDAAHPTLPFLAQGANMALEDAWVLAQCLASLPRVQALAAYQRQRRARVVRVIAAANANARNYHLRNPALRLAAHGALRLAGALAPAQLLGQFDWVYEHDVTRA